MLVAAEDTRETTPASADALRNFGRPDRPVTSITNPIPWHRVCSNELDARTVSVALVSDAGTPLISDPGYTLVAAARERGLSVVPIPGASAAICALSASGLPSDRFLFLGFPPRTQPRRRAWIERSRAEPGTLILYESAKRALETLRDLQRGPGRRRGASSSRAS
jgi:16S rRNA (cytidine(1402)-2'-O)-methyltransferase